jgi:hypothetical protein
MLAVKLVGGELAAARGVSVPIDTAFTLAFAVALVPVVVPVVVLVVVLGTVYEFVGVVTVVVAAVVVEMLGLVGRGTCTPFTMMVAMSGPWITTS